MVRVGPVVLLILLALAGLRGALVAPRWNGPLRGAGIGIGVSLIAVLATLFVITWLRRRAALAAAERASTGGASTGGASTGGAEAALGDTALGAGEMDVAAKLRFVLLYVLGTGTVSVVIAMLFAAHLHLLARPKPPKLPPQAQPTSHQVTPPAIRPQAGTGNFHIPFAVIAYSLLVLALITAIVPSIRWSARLRVPARPGREAAGEEDPEDLREAVASGRSALRTLDDARAAIIACYLAMEQSLAERGAARAAADTPDELLERATKNKLIRGTSAARLTALFYEARFSSHPMDRAQRQAAEQALDELAAAAAAAGQAEPAAQTEPTAAHREAP